MPRISVIIPCYNGEAFVAEALQSVQAQTFSDWEAIVVDDGSTDRSAKVVGEVADRDARIHLHRQANGGVCRARNAGYRQAAPSSEYVLFLDADDRLRRRMLETLAAYLDAHPEIGVAYCMFDKIDVNGAVVDPDVERPRMRPRGAWLEEVPLHEPETHALTVFEGKVVPSVTLIRRSVVRPPLFDEDLNIQPNDDADAFTMLALRAPVHLVPESLVEKRQHPQMSTRSNRGESSRAKLLEKWRRDIDGLNASQQRMRAAIWYDYHGKVVPQIWLGEASKSFQASKILRAAAFAGGAAARYGVFAVRRLMSI
jgi:glycosyltransferase involved in cell wall biosynthesis